MESIPEITIFGLKMIWIGNNQMNRIEVFSLLNVFRSQSPTSSTLFKDKTLEIYSGLIIR